VASASGADGVGAATGDATGVAGRATRV